jgi:hypothetical protein
MVIDPPERLVATIDGCRAYVGARLRYPERADLLLRALRRQALHQGSQKCPERPDRRAITTPAS